jgi:hypothetical protein
LPFFSRSVFMGCLLLKPSATPHRKAAQYIALSLVRSTSEDC